MRLHVIARHMELNRALLSHVRRRFLNELPRHYDRDSCDLRVELDHPVGETKRRYEEVRAKLTVPGALLVVHARAQDLFTAVDDAYKQLVRRVDEWRGRKLARRHPNRQL